MRSVPTENQNKEDCSGRAPPGGPRADLPHMRLKTRYLLAVLCVGLLVTASVLLALVLSEAHELRHVEAMLDEIAASRPDSAQAVLLTVRERLRELLPQLYSSILPLVLGAGAVLTALAACVTTSIVYHAAAKGIAIRSMESRLEGDIDLQGFLGIRDDIPRGFKEIRMFVKIDADAPPEKLEEVVNLGPTYSPVFDTITRAVPVSVQLDK